MLDVRLYLAQRISALIMVPLVLGHLAVMIYAIQGGLSAAEILGRTKGSFFWFAFYGLFVLAISVHASIGVRVIVHEWTGIGKRALDIFTLGVGFILSVLGAWSVMAVTLT
jgi:fumarate reductase subunit C